MRIVLSIVICAQSAECLNHLVTLVFATLLQFLKLFTELLIRDLFIVKLFPRNDSLGMTSKNSLNVNDANKNCMKIHNDYSRQRNKLFPSRVRLTTVYDCVSFSLQPKHLSVESELTSPGLIVFQGLQLFGFFVVEHVWLLHDFALFSPLWQQALPA